MCGGKYVHCIYEAHLVLDFMKFIITVIFSLTSFINCGPPTGALNLINVVYH